MDHKNKIKNTNTGKNRNKYFINESQWVLFMEFGKLVANIFGFLKDNDRTLLKKFNEMGLMLLLINTLRDQNKKGKRNNEFNIRTSKMLKGIENFVDEYKLYIESNRRNFLKGTCENGNICISYNSKIYLDLTSIWGYLTKNQKVIVWDYLVCFTVMLFPECADKIKQRIYAVRNTKETKMLSQLMGAIGDLGIDKDAKEGGNPQNMILNAVSKAMSTDFLSKIKDIDLENVDMDNLLDAVKYAASDIIEK